MDTLLQTLIKTPNPLDIQELEKDNIYRQLQLKQQKQQKIVKELEDKIKQLDEEITDLLYNN